MLGLDLSIVLLLILLNGFFAMAEIALVSARNARLQPLATAGNAGARTAIELKADPSRLLSTGPDRRHPDRGPPGHFWRSDLGRSIAETIRK